MDRGYIKTHLFEEMLEDLAKRAKNGFVFVSDGKWVDDYVITFGTQLEPAQVEDGFTDAFHPIVTNRGMGWEPLVGPHTDFPELELNLHVTIDPDGKESYLIELGEYSEFPSIPGECEYYLTLEKDEESGEWYWREG